jgi:hypothetical protein
MIFFAKSLDTAERFANHELFIPLAVSGQKLKLHMNTFGGVSSPQLVLSEETVPLVFVIIDDSAAPATFGAPQTDDTAVGSQSVPVNASDVERTSQHAILGGAEAAAPRGGEDQQ